MRARWVLLLLLLSPLAAQADAAVEGSPALLIWTGQEAPVRELCLSDDGRYAGMLWPRRVEVWDLQAFERLFVEESKGPEFRCLACTRDGKEFVCGGDEGWLKRIGPVNHGEPFQKSVGLGLTAVCYSPSGSELFASYREGVVRVLNSQSLEVLGEIKTQEFGRTFIDLSADGKRLLSGAADQLAGCWDVSSGELVTRLNGQVRGLKAHLGMLMDVKFLPGEDRALTAAFQDGMSLAWNKPKPPEGDDTLRLWDLKTGAPLKALRVPVGVHRLSVLPGGQRVLFIQSYYGNPWGKVFLLDLDAWTYAEAADDPGKERFGFGALAAAANGRMALLGSAHGRVILFDLRALRQVAALHTSKADWAVTAADGRYDFAGELSGKIDLSAEGRTPGLWRELHRTLAQPKTPSGPER